MQFNAKMNLKFEKSKLETIAILSILFIGAILRLYNIDKNSLWLDESGQYIVAIKEIPVLIDGVSKHLSPPLDYIIMHFFLKFTPANELFIRMPAAIFGTASILLLFLIGKKLFSTKVGFISSFLLSISPFAIQYSQEARMYSSFLFFTLVSFYAFINFIDLFNRSDLHGNKNSQKMNFLFWVLSGILLIYTHYFGFFVIFIQFLFIMLVIMILKIKIHNLLKKSIVGFSIIGISFLFWVNIFLMQTFGGQKILPYGMNDYWKNFFYYPLIYFSGLSGGLSENILILFLTLMFSIGMIFGIRKHLKSMILLIMWIGVPLLILFLLTVVRGPNTTDRNLIFILPGCLLLLSLGIFRTSELLYFFVQRRLYLSTNKILILILIIMFYLTLPNISNYYESEKPNWRDVGIFLTEKTKSEDKIIILGGTPEHLNFYYKGNATYSNPKTIEELLSMIKNKQNNITGCTWVFISGYSNVFWKTDNKNITNKSLIIESLDKNAEKISGLYSETDWRGVYKICTS